MHGAANITKSYAKCKLKARWIFNIYCTAHETFIVLWVCSTYPLQRILFKTHGPGCCVRQPNHSNCWNNVICQVHKALSVVYMSYFNYHPNRSSTLWNFFRMNVLLFSSVPHHYTTIHHLYYCANDLTLLKKNKKIKKSIKVHV